MKDSEFYKDVKKNEYLESQFNDFWRCASVCHDVIVFKYDNKDHFSGRSQDEIVILEAGRTSSFCTLIGKDSDSVSIKMGEDNLEKYTILKVIEFDSDRKMMTVVGKNNANGKIYVFCKGADMAILPLVKDKLSVATATQDILTLSRKGYRTLVYAIKEITEDKVDDPIFLENDLKLVGVTGVEDLLQDRVVECIHDFREAGIKVWMLTGDKGETAQEIGYSCGLFERDNFPVFMLQEQDEKLEDQLKSIHA